ncbi:MAG: c-type cytochrome biogenesis protein CcmI/CycH [Acidobacteriota bacterium]
MRQSIALAAAVFLVAALAACSQNEYSMKGPAPKAPEHYRDAHIVIKGRGAGMNAMPVPEDQTDEDSGQASGQTQTDGSGAKASAGQTTQGQALYAGTIELPASLKADFTPGETLFIIGRAADQPVPVAAKKLAVSSFPVEFTLGPGDSMTGQSLPSSMEILARLDKDGNLNTENPKDMTAGPEMATSGSRITLTLHEAGK